MQVFTLILQTWFFFVFAIWGNSSEKNCLANFSSTFFTFWTPLTLIQLSMNHNDRSYTRMTISSSWNLFMWPVKTISIKFKFTKATNKTLVGLWRVLMWFLKGLETQQPDPQLSQAWCLHQRTSKTLKIWTKEIFCWIFFGFNIFI